jgi:hypothetical protein
MICKQRKLSGEVLRMFLDPHDDILSLVDCAGFMNLRPQ